MTSILTGDIINSRNVSSSDWMPMLKELFNSIGNAPKVWEIYRGDSFQIEIENPEEALLFALKLKASIKKNKDLDVRIAIGIGKKNSDYNNITEASGDAFINSGFAFDNLLKKQNLAITSSWKLIDETINTTLALALLTMDDWTTNSAVFVEKYLEKSSVTQKKIAKELQISESSASERRKRSGIDEIMRLERLYRKLIAEKI